MAHRMQPPRSPCDGEGASSCYHSSMRLADFDYELPAELIAQQPLPGRSASRLLVLDGASGCITDRAMGELPLLLERGDLLVFNDTRVVAARLAGRKASGGRVEIFLERPLDDRRALVHLRASKPVRSNLDITTSGGVVRVLERLDDLWIVEVPGEPLEFFERCGEVPLPPYIRRAPHASDRERYQSVFARVPGAVAAPTASLHFDAALLAALEARGVDARVTLHVGAGTFQPVRAEQPSEHRMHPERMFVSQKTCDAIARARAAERRVVAVGTTVARTLESALREG